MRWGDSLQGNGPGPVAQIALQKQLGINGYAVGVDGGTVAVLGASTVTVTSGSSWMTGSYYSGTTGQGVEWTNNQSLVASQSLTEGHFYFFAEPSAGSFQLKSSTNGSTFTNEPLTSGTVQYSYDGGITWTTSTNGIVSATNASLTCGVVKVTYPAIQSKYFEGVVTTGAVRFPTANAIYSIPGNGYIAASNIVKGGWTLGWMLTTSTNIIIPFLRDAAPDLVLFEMAHDSSAQPSYLSQLKSLFTAAGLSTDFSICGLHAGMGGPDVSGGPLNGTYVSTWQMNEFERYWAVTNGAHFFDCYAMSGGDPVVMGTRGWLDGTATAIPITAATWTSGTMTITTGTTYTPGTTADLITNCVPSGFNVMNTTGTNTIISGTQFSFPWPNNPGSFVSGGVVHADTIHPSAVFQTMSGNLWAKSITDITLAGAVPNVSASTITVTTITATNATAQAILLGQGGSGGINITAHTAGVSTGNLQIGNDDNLYIYAGNHSAACMVDANGVVHTSGIMAGSLGDTTDNTTRVTVNHNGSIDGYTANGGTRYFHIDSSGFSVTTGVFISGTTPGVSGTFGSLNTITVTNGIITKIQ